MKLDLPAGACNAHCHVFGPRGRFPYAADAPFIPEHDATSAELYALNDRLGLQRCVVVQSTCHGFDNSVTEDAIAGRPRDYRGIALVRPDVSGHELVRLDAAGIRGIRFNFAKHLGSSTPIDDILALATRFAPLGWHLQIHGAPSLLTDLGPAFLRSPVPVVIDHIGRIDAGLGLDQADFKALQGLMRDSRFWVKVSGMERISREAAPWRDAHPYARALVEEFPDRVLWGNDWPHPNLKAGPPDDDLLVDLIEVMAPQPAERRRLLVDNPHRLYRFG
ncbi:amidohydrolase family protein [soil metagenome]